MAKTTRVSSLNAGTRACPDCQIVLSVGWQTVRTKGTRRTQLRTLLAPTGTVLRNWQRNQNAVKDLMSCAANSSQVGTGWWLGATRSVTPPPLWIAPWISTLLALLAIKMMCPLLGASGLLEAGLGGTSIFLVPGTG